MALAETAELAVRISLEDNVSAGVRGLQKNLGGLNRSLATTGKGFGQIGAGVARAGLVVGGAAVTGLGAAAKAAIDFEDAFAGVRKTVSEADLVAAGLTFEDLARQFRDMATEIPIAATELAAIGETAGALGIKAKDIEEFTETVALLGVTTDLSSDQAAEALGKVGTILGLTGRQFRDFADVLVNLGNQGASVESEIIETTKRFAAIGRQAGLTTEQILALSSAATSLGAEPEAAGSALSRIFDNMTVEIANATDKGKTFAKVTGQSLDQLAARINKGDALGIVLDTLKKIEPMSRTGRASVLRALGIGNVRDRNAIVNMLNNLEFVNDQLQIAENSAGALGVEATKRFATVASKITLLKQNVNEAAITIGEGFAPAIGRAAEKLAAFLKLDANKARLSEFGKDIGDSIDAIDWNAVLQGAEQFVGILKGALSFAKLLYDAFSTLPGPIKEATAGFLVLNKLSGNLLARGAGNVIGGLAGAAVQGVASRAPGVGRLFAQPVFVTNFPPGFGGTGGVGGVAGKGGGVLGKLGNALGILSIVGSVVAVVGEQQAISAESTEQAKNASATLKEFLRQNPNEQALKNALGGVEQGIRDIESNPLSVLVQGDALNELKNMRADIQRQLANQQKGVVGPEVFGPPKPGTPLAGKTALGPIAPGAIEEALARGRAKGFFPSESAGLATVERNMTRAAEAQTARLAEVKAEQVRTTSATQLVAANALRAGERTAGALSSIPAPIVTVNVGISSTNVIHKTIQIRRTGPTGGSRERSGPLEFG